MNDFPTNSTPGSDPWNPQNAGQPQQPANPYGQPTADPYAQPATQQPYGQPTANPYGQPTANPYGQPSYDPNAMANPYGQQGYPAMTPAYSSWFKRLGGYLIDGAIPGILGGVAGSFAPQTDPTTGMATSDGNPMLLILLLLASFAFTAWNRWFRAGKTGQSIGRSALGMKMLAEANGQPIGAGKAFLRDLAHILDGILYIGYIMAAFDAKRQTFADKIMSTVVVDS